MTTSDYDEDSYSSSNRNSSSNDESLCNSKYYKIVEITVDNYSWNIIDLIDNKKKLLFRVNAHKHINLLEVLSRIEHENIWHWKLFKENNKYFAIESEDYYQLSESLWFCLEKCRQENNQLDEEQIVIWLKQFLSAIECLHLNNILVQKLDIFTRLLDGKVMLNVEWDCEVLESRMKSVPVSAYDVKYMAPEFARYKKIGTKYDIWSLGWILYELCTLTNPLSYLHTIHSFEDWDPPNLPTDISDELKNVFKMMIQVNENDRPTAGELLKLPIFNKPSDDVFKLGKIFNRKYKLVKEVKQNLKWIFQDLKENNQLKQAYLIDDISFCKRNAFQSKLAHSFIQRWDYLEVKSHFLFIKPVFQVKLSARLEDFKEKKIFPSEDLVIEWIRKLTSALNYLHQHNILHTWINPREIGFENDEIKLSLFPEMQCLKWKHEKVKINQLDIFYNCPEFWQTGTINLKYDIWSLGWTMYQLCTLDNYIMIWLEKIKKFSETAHPILPKYFSDELRNLFNRMTDYDCEKRPFADELLEDAIFRF